MKLSGKTLHFVSSLLPLIVVTTLGSRDTIYNWQTGPWGVCWSERSCGEGVEERAVWCGDYLGRPVPYRLCDHSEEPGHSRPCYQACKGHWRTGIWSRCIIKPIKVASTTSSRLCQGNRQRNVSCVISGNTHKTNCSQPPPPTNVACYTDCPQSCVVGPWSKWTPCFKCHETSYRTRQVIIAPSDTGTQCPQLSESKQCNVKCDDATKLEPIINKTNSNIVKIKVGKWGDCKLVQFQPHFATDYEASAIESDIEDNHVSHNAFVEIHNAELILQSQLLDNVTYNQLPSNQINTISNAIIEIGFQERNVTCLGGDGQTLDIRFCQSSDVLRKRSCVIPEDCKLTEWSSWSVIQVGCVAPNGQKIPEIRTRTRRALNLQKGSGIPCAHLFEKHSFSPSTPLPCNSRYQWLASSWGPCLSTVGPYPQTEVYCGGGVQKRNIVCIRTDGHIPVDNDFCKFVDPPPVHQRCEVGCGRDCVVSLWSNWSVCNPLTCADPPSIERTGFRRRSRKIIVFPSSSGSECPPLEEQALCIHPQCHRWKIGEWSDCLLDDLSQKCGTGMQSRNLLCIDMHGIPAPKSACESVLGPVPERKKCQIPCPFDCVLAEWSAWTPCSRTCANEMSVGYSRRNTTILAPPGSGGHECPPPDELTEVKTCRDEPCGGTAWVTSEWHECIVRTENCGNGWQHRNIYCVDQLEDKRLPSYRCSGLKMPKVKKSCEIKCNNECSLSNWSEWSNCLEPNICSDERTMVNSIQIRWRVLLSQLTNNQICGNLTEQRTCVISAKCHQRSSWKTSIWSGCILAPGIRCGTGYRVRDVTCINEDDGVSEPTKCLLESIIVPPRSEACFVFCNSSCSLSKWSDWSPCDVKSFCSDSRSQRARFLLGESNNKKACSSINLMETQPCPCQIFSLEVVIPWSTCILDDEQNERSMQSLDSGFSVIIPLDGIILNNYANATMHQTVFTLCGVGTKFRSVRCIGKNGSETDSSFCENNGIEKEPCMVECSKNCLVGLWEEWSNCDSSCGAGMQIRYRQVVQKTVADGRKCPSTNQQRSCWGNCETKWIADGWRECDIPKNSRCGNGTQNRTVKCIQKDDSGLERETRESNCDPGRRLSNSRDCRVFCPGECVVSEWSNWSSCHQNCTPSNERIRKRSIIRTPSITTKDCSHLEERETCLENVACWKHSWVLGNWTSCVPLGHSSCGEGVRNRPLSCIRSDGQAVHESFCSKEKRPVNLERWCYVDCPVDCSVSSWAPWDKSKCSCGEKPGIMIRTRFVLVHPSESGRKCPTIMQERRPCAYNSCYTWERGPWSSCYLNGGNCGHGVMRRNVSCRGSQEMIVANEKCLTLIHIGGHTWPYLSRALDLNEKDSCYVPGNGDCEITEWSNWSHCHRDCWKGAQGGTQTRSRAVIASGSLNSCSADLWESRPCLAGPCMTFSWQIIRGRATCIRSDGLVVTGGCGDSPRPCNPPCTMYGSMCSPVGVCVCKLTFRPQYSEAEKYHLTKCVSTFNFSLAKTSLLTQGKYLPENMNVWMFAMLAVGSAFVVFVIISVYVMCKTPQGSSQLFHGHRRQNNFQERSAQFQ